MNAGIEAPSVDAGVWRLRALRPSRPKRAAALALAILLELLLIAVLLGLGGSRQKPEPRGRQLSVTLLPNASDEPAPAAQPKKSAQTATAAPTPVTKAPLAPPKPIVRLPTPKSAPALPILVLSKEDLAAADISKLGTKGQSGGPSGELASAAGDSQPIGTGPDGQPLYNAEWLREPTNQELAGYLPSRMPPAGGVGLVACRTAPRNRVEDCVELGNFPAGSHLAASVRQAAWQFLVIPPRKGGKPMIGEWVRIRIEYQARSE